MEQLRKGIGKPPTPTELIRLYRTNMKRIWDRSAWWPGQTLWFCPAIEADFVEGCRRAGLDPTQTAPLVANTLRWGWKRTQLDRRDDPGWQRALAAARKRQAKIGPPAEDYVYTPPEDTPPTDPRIKAVFQRLNAFQLAQTRPPVDRTTKAKARKAHSHRFRAPVSFDWSAFLTAHWSATFGPLFAAHHLDPAEVDGELGRRLAVTWQNVLAEQVKLGDGACGAAYGHWMALLRQIRQDKEQGTKHYLRRP
jgi:hypothetical protein